MESHDRGWIVLDTIAYSRQSAETKERVSEGTSVRLDRGDVVVFQWRSNSTGGQATEATGHEGKETGLERVYWGSDPYEVLFAEIVDRVAIGDPPTPTASGVEGAEAVAVIEAAYESGRRNEPVAVDYDRID
jgi:predicted dehydrogenase